jgi:hypothetical protein
MEKEETLFAAFLEPVATRIYIYTASERTFSFVSELCLFPLLFKISLESISYRRRQIARIALYKSLPFSSNSGRPQTQSSSNLMSLAGSAMNLFAEKIDQRFTLATVTENVRSQNKQLTRVASPKKHM